MWIPIFYYCGLNQFIMQRTLAAKNLRQGQLGIILAAALWVLVPFIIVFPGIIALQLYGGEMDKADQAFPMLIRNLIPNGLRGFMFAAIAGAVISSLASMLNSASTIFTMDIYKRYLKPDASQQMLVTMGRGTTLIFLVAGCLIAPFLGNERFGGIFNYIQEFQGYISPGILAAFVFGFVVKRAPEAAGAVALILSAVIYGFLQWQFSHVAYLNRMAITFAAIIAVMAVMTLVRPNIAPKALPVREEVEVRTDPVVFAAGGVVLTAVAAFYVIFW
jgi:SSS family solute:Na+ symporter